MKKICLIAGLILSMVSNEVTAQSAASAQPKHGFVLLANEVVVIQAKATVTTLKGTWKAPAGGAFKIRVVALGARASDRNGVAAEPGTCFWSRRLGSVLHYSLGPIAGDAGVYIDDGHDHSDRWLEVGKPGWKAIWFLEEIIKHRNKSENNTLRNFCRQSPSVSRGL
jgi:hypothetical protein